MKKLLFLLTISLFVSCTDDRQEGDDYFAENDYERALEHYLVSVYKLDHSEVSCPHACVPQHYGVQARTPSNPEMGSEDLPMPVRQAQPMADEETL